MGIDRYKGKAKSIMSTRNWKRLEEKGNYGRGIDPKKGMIGRPKVNT